MGEGHAQVLDSEEVRATKNRGEHLHHFARRLAVADYAGCVGCDAVRPIPRGPVLAQEHSETSKEAARSLTTPRRDATRQQVYDALRNAGYSGLTAEKIEEITGLAGDTVRPRLVELDKAFQITRTKETRMTKSNRPAQVWRVRA